MLTVLFANAFAGPLSSQHQQYHQSQQSAQEFPQDSENFRGPENFRGRQGFNGEMQGGPAAPMMARGMPPAGGAMPPMPPGQMWKMSPATMGMSPPGFPSMQEMKSMDTARDPKVEFNMQFHAPFFMMRQSPMMPPPQMFNGMPNQMQGGKQFGMDMPPQMFNVPPPGMFNRMLGHQFALNMPPQMGMFGPMMFRGQPMGLGMGMFGPDFGGPQRMFGPDSRSFQASQFGQKPFMGMFGPGPQRPQSGPQFWQKSMFDGEGSMAAHWRRDSDQPLDRQDLLGTEGSDVSSMRRWQRDSEQTVDRRDRFGNEGSDDVSSLDDQKLYVSLLKEKYDLEAAQLRQMENVVPRSSKRNL